MSTVQQLSVELPSDCLMTHLLTLDGLDSPEKKEKMANLDIADNACFISNGIIISDGFLG
jgi:hypothetical protein